MMSRTMSIATRNPSVATAVWSLSIGLLLAAGGSPLEACDDGRTVRLPNHHTGLVEDCKVLLASRDELAGTGNLNWKRGLEIDTWDGITIPEWFDAAGIDTEFLQDFRGVLLLRAEEGSVFAPLGIRFGKRGNSLSAVPAIPVTVVPD